MKLHEFLKQFEGLDPDFEMFRYEVKDGNETTTEVNKGFDRIERFVINTNPEIKEESVWWKVIVLY